MPKLLTEEDLQQFDVVLKRNPNHSWRLMVELLIASHRALEQELSECAAHNRERNQSLLTKLSLCCERYNRADEWVRALAATAASAEQRAIAAEIQLDLAKRGWSIEMQKALAEHAQLKMCDQHPDRKAIHSGQCVFQSDNCNCCRECLYQCVEQDKEHAQPQSEVEMLSGPIVQGQMDARGGLIWFSREQWGVILDALIDRSASDARKAQSPDRMTDLRSDLCIRIIQTINSAEHAQPIPYESRLRTNEGADVIRADEFSANATDAELLDWCEEHQEEFDGLVTRAHIREAIRGIPLVQERPTDGERNYEAMYRELVDALCSPSWLPRNKHESVVKLAKRLHDSQAKIYPQSQGCTLPPEGWYCTREPGHEGPCAAEWHYSHGMRSLNE
jgi:hypothetical protein